MMLASHDPLIDMYTIHSYTTMSCYNNVALGPPNLKDNFFVKIEENSENVSIDLHQEPAAFPEPSSFVWYKDGLPLTGFEQTYSNVTFDFIGRMNTGNYTVFSSNFVLGGSME